MGTMIALLLVLSTLAGCASDTLTDIKNAALPEETAGAAYFALTSEIHDGTVLDGDGVTELIDYSYEVPVLQAVRLDGTVVTEAENALESRQLEAAELFNAQFANWSGEALNAESSITAAAREYRSLQHSTPLEDVIFTEYLTCTAYIKGRIVSVSGVYENYAGGAHPNTMMLSWNFDLDTMQFFEPQLLEDGGGLHKAVQEELLRQTRAVAAERGIPPEELFCPDYESILADWSSYAVSFGEEGMTVAFSPYELACYAEGAQIFHLSYEWLAPLLSEQSRHSLGLSS